MPKEIFSAISELKEIRKREPKKLSPDSAQKVKALLCYLKRNAYSDRQISDMLDNAWSRGTIRAYTQGVVLDEKSRGAKDDEVMHLFRDLLDSGMPIEDIPTALDAKKKCDLLGIDMKEVAAFLNDCGKNSSSPAAVIGQFLQLLSEGQISVKQFKEIYQVLKELEKQSYGLDTIRKLGILAQSYNADEFLDAAAKYGTKVGLEQDVQRLSMERTKIWQQVQSKQTEGKALEERKHSIQSTLDKYEKIKSEGMTGGMLNGIVHASAKFGGPENLFAAINEFTSLEQFKVRQSQLKSECQEWQAKIRSLQVENASIAEVVKMCETLLYDYKLSVPSIERIRTAAKVYGNPGDIIKAITEIGGLQAIEMAVKSDEDKRDRLLAEVGELKKQKAQLEGQIDAFNTIAIPKMLNEIPAALKRQFESSLEPSVQVFSQYVNTLSNQVQRYHQSLGQTQALEQQLDIVRVFLAVRNIPDHKIRYAAYYAYDFIIAAGNLCYSNGVNPKVKVKDVCGNKYSLLPSYAEIELWDLLKMTGFGVGHLAGGSMGAGVATA